MSFLMSVVLPAPKKPEKMSIFVITDLFLSIFCKLGKLTVTFSILRPSYIIYHLSRNFNAGDALCFGQ